MSSTEGATVVRQRRFNLDWLKPPKPDEDGSMALVDHLKELRYRVIVSVVVITIAMLGCMVFYQKLYQLVMHPFNIAIADYKAKHPHADVITSAEGLSAPIMMMMKMGLYAGLVVSCPIWLYQIWAFIAPGLLAKEKKYALYFLGASIPLFLTGIALGYWISPKGFTMLLGFTPDVENVTNIQEINKFMSFLTIMLLVFGISFLLPVILVTLNLVGVLKAATMGKYRTLAFFLCFVFGAVATPSADPFSMLALAVPMVVMYILSEIICTVNDRRRAARGDDLDVVLED